MHVITIHYIIHCYILYDSAIGYHYKTYPAREYKIITFCWFMAHYTDTMLTGKHFISERTIWLILIYSSNVMTAALLLSNGS